jgi:hypothetical protein
MGPWRVSSDGGAVAWRACVGGVQQQHRPSFCSPTSINLSPESCKLSSPSLFLLSLVQAFSLLRRGGATRGGGLRHARWWLVAWWWPAMWPCSDPRATPWHHRPWRRRWQLDEGGLGSGPHNLSSGLEIFSKIFKTNFSCRLT